LSFFFGTANIPVSSNSFIPPDPTTQKFKGNPGTRIFLFRHGETANAHEVCLNGHYDVDLSDKGLEQMRQIADSLNPHPIRAVYSSDLQRTTKGAALVAKAHGLDPVSLPELRELSFGHWEGMSLKELETKYPGEMDKRIKETEAFRADGGETFGELHDRVIPAFKNIVDRHAGETIVLLCHGGVNRVILSHVLGFPTSKLFSIAQEYAAVNIIQYYRDQVVVELLNGTHLHISASL